MISAMVAHFGGNLRVARTNHSNGCIRDKIIALS